MKRLKWLILLLVTSCVTGEDETYETLLNQGFTEINVRGTAPFMCGEHDKLGRVFDATNTNQKRVTGVVCCGTFKGCTIRW